MVALVAFSGGFSRSGEPTVAGRRVKQFVIRLDKSTNKTEEGGIANPQLIAAELQIALPFGQRPLVRLNRGLI